MFCKTTAEDGPEPGYLVVSVAKSYDNRLGRSIAVETRKIGDATVSVIGCGAMSISTAYRRMLPDEERMKVCALPVSFSCFLIRLPPVLLRYPLGSQCGIGERVYALGHRGCLW